MFLTTGSFLFDISLVQHYSDAPPSVKCTMVSIEQSSLMSPLIGIKTGAAKFCFNPNFMRYDRTFAILKFYGTQFVHRMAKRASEHGPDQHGCLVTKALGLVDFESAVSLCLSSD